MDEARNKIIAYFDDFNDAFATFDGNRVAEKFSFPFFARSRDGISKVLNDPSELAHYFQQYLNEYRAMGCVLCRYGELQIEMLGKEAAVASIRWSLLDAGMATVLSWHESYVLTLGSGMPTAFATIDHVQ